MTYGVLARLGFVGHDSYIIIGTSQRFQHGTDKKSDFLLSAILSTAVPLCYIDQKELETASYDHGEVLCQYC